MSTRSFRARRRRGFSLLELLAVVTILGIIAVVVIPRISISAGAAKDNAHKQNLAELNSAIERYYFNTGKWPSADMRELNNVDFFPDGLPSNPTNGKAYRMNKTTHRVVP